MITLTTANNALKDAYLGVLANKLNDSIDCVLGKIKQTTEDVWGKEIIVLTCINGNHYQLTSELANIYGKLELSDKAIRCSQNSASAFVNLLNDEVEQLVLNTSRQITNAFYGKDEPCEYLTEKEKAEYQPLVLNGLRYLFDDEEKLLYGVEREEIKPITKTISKFDDMSIQEIIDDCNEDINFIICSPKTKRQYQEYLNNNHRNIEMNRGFKCIAFDGIIPIVANKNVPDNEMYLINTDDFKLHQLCDWKWIEGEDGNILRQDPYYPKYSAQLVKYANYICEQPQRQIKIVLEN